MFKLIYLDHVDKVENAFGQWGSHCHECFERFFKEEILAFEVLDAYLDSYSLNITEDFPPNKWKDLNASYLEAGKKFFSNIKDVPPQWEVIAVEQRTESDFGGYKFVGYIDLVLKNKETGKIIIVDHKSKAMFTSAEEQRHYAIQLYLYAEYIKRTYGVYPDMLVFNMFRVDQTVKIPFNEIDYFAAIDWFVYTIQQIYADKKFDDKIKIDFHSKGKKLREYRFADFFCAYICSARQHCLRSKQKGRRKS